MTMTKFDVGDRVRYVVYPSGTPSKDTVGTVVRVERGEPTQFYVEWDDVDNTKYTPAAYEGDDLAEV